jgi:hypothetical protein
MPIKEMPIKEILKPDSRFVTNNVKPEPEKKLVKIRQI